LFKALVAMTDIEKEEGELELTEQLTL